MIKIDIGNPDEFQLASVVDKNSRTGITSNRRLLAIKHGHLHYYSNVPKSFKGDPKVEETIHQLPKCSIEVPNIRKINGLENNSAYFSIQFQAKYMMQREDIRKTMTNEDFNFTPKNTSEVITWQFTCDNQFTKQKWVSSLELLKSYFQKQKINIEKFFKNNEKSDEVSSGRASMKIPWRDTQLRKSTSSELLNLDFKKNSPRSDSKNSSPNLLKKNIEISPGISQKKLTNYPKSYQDNHLYKQDNTFQNIFNCEIGQERQQQFNVKIKNQQPQQTKSITYTYNVPSPFRKSVPITMEEQKQNSPRLQSQPNNFQSSNLLCKQKIQEQMDDNQKDQQININNIKLPLVRNQTEEFERQLLQVNLFYSLQNKIFPSSGLSFNQRIQNQRKLIKYMNNFKIQVIHQFEEFVLQFSTTNRKTLYNKYNCTKISATKIQFNIKNRLFRIVFIQPEPILFSGSKKIFYNEEHMKNLKRQFKIYDEIWQEVILKQLKQNTDLHLRVPLCIFLEYKGVCCLVMQDNEQMQKINLLMKQKKFIEEKLLMKNNNYDPNKFIFTYQGQFIIAKIKPPKQSNYEQNTIKQYLNRILYINKTQKHHNITFQPPLCENFILTAQKQNASISLKSLGIYIESLSSMKQFEGICPKLQIIEILSYCKFAKCLRKIYRAAEGQINQTAFLNLIFKSNPQIISILKQTDCMIPILKGNFLGFINHYLGIICEVNEKELINLQQINLTSGKNVIISTQIHTLSRQYSLNQLELYQSIRNFNKYLSLNQLQLAIKAINLQKSLLTDKSSLLQKLQILYNYANLNYHRKNFTECISYSENYIQLCNKYSSFLLQVYILMFKAYSEVSEPKMTTTLHRTQQFITFNYGVNHSSLISLYCLAAFYYQKFAKKNVKEEKQFTDQAMKYLLEAKSLTLKSFGDQSKQYTEILMDISRHYRRKGNYLESIESLILAKRSVSSKDATLQFKIMLDECAIYLYSGDQAKCEERLFKLYAKLDERIPKQTYKQLYKLEYFLGEYCNKYQYCSNSVEKLWNIGYYSLSLQLSIKLSLKYGLSFSFQQNQQQQTAQCKSKMILYIENKKQTYGQIQKIVQDALKNDNQEIIQAIRSIIN